MTAPGGALPGALPLVTVALPVHNGAATVAEAIRSVLAQGYRPIECVVVDDGSTDGTGGVLESFGSAIRVVRQAQGGIAAARNAGLREARGDLIALMDADDICEPERLSVQARFLRDHPGVALCCSDFSAFSAAGTLAESFIGTYYHQCSPERGGAAARYPHHATLDIRDCLPEPTSGPVTVPIHHGAVYDELALGNFVHPPTVMFRREVLDAAGWFDSSIPIMCEWDWLVRVAREGAVGFIDRPLLRYRLSDGQVSSSAEAPLDAVHVALRILERDPALRSRHRAEARHLLGGLFADAANAEIDTHHRWAALRLLAASAFRYGTVNGRTVRILGKILLPASAQGLLRDLFVGAASVV